MFDIDSLLSLKQPHLAAQWEHWSEAKRQRFEKVFEDTSLNRLIEAIEGTAVAEEPTASPSIAPPHSIDGSDLSSPESLEALNQGMNLLREGKIAILVVAGGMGTRLGWPAPKGTFPVGPVTERSLFQLFAEQIHGLNQLSGRSILWAVQTSEGNHDDTQVFFEKNHHFGLAEESIRLFSQGTLPAFLEDGRLALNETQELVRLPDGHGGVYRAMERNGILQWFEENGVEHVYYFQVDNPLSILADPRFMGFHAKSGSEMSTVVIKKERPEERVGVLAEEEHTLRVIEYSEISPELAAQRDADGQLSFRAANTGIHAFRLQFLKQMGQTGALPLHLARKPVPHGGTPTAGIKMEYFVFDGLAKAKRPLVYEVPREGHFAPVKNAEGSDSPTTSRAALSRFHKRQLQSIGIASPEGEIELPFRFLWDEEGLRKAVAEGASSQIKK